MINYEIDNDCSNRTFMELKYNRKKIRHGMIESSNRTFMELKFLKMNKNLI